MNNKCPYCGSFRNVCMSQVSFEYLCLACEKLFFKSEQQKQTVFDRITVSPEVLAVEFVGMMYDRLSGEDRYYSMLTDEFYNNYDEAVAVTATRLKEFEK